MSIKATHSLSAMSKEQIISCLIEVFRRYGYEGTTLVRLSQATGLNKASLYYHFPKGKEEMAEAALDQIDRWLETEILVLLRQSETPLRRLRLMSKSVEQFFKEGKTACLWAVFALGDGDDLFHARIHRALTLWIEALAHVITESGIGTVQSREKAEDAILQIQGALMLARSLKNTEPFQRVLKRLPEELLNS